MREYLRARPEVAREIENKIRDSVGVALIGANGQAAE